MTPARRGQGKVKNLAIASVVEKSRKLISPHWLTPLASALIIINNAGYGDKYMLNHDKEENRFSAYAYRAEVEGFGAARLDSCLSIQKKRKANFRLCETAQNE